MNIDTSNLSNATKRYLEKLMEHNLFQKTRAFTRITARTKSTLDHVVTKINDLKTLVSHFCIADHQAVVACWGQKADKTSNTVIKNNNEQDTVTLCLISLAYNESSQASSS
jgi:hypothetical protein